MVEVTAPKPGEPKRSLMEQLKEVKMPKIASSISEFPPKPEIGMDGTRKPFTELELRDKFNSWYDRFNLLTGSLTDAQKLLILVAKIVDPLSEWFTTQIRSCPDITYDVIRIRLEEKFQSESADLAVLREIHKSKWDSDVETFGSWIGRLNALWDRLSDKFPEAHRVNFIKLQLETDLIIQQSLSVPLSSVTSMTQLEMVLMAFQDSYLKIKAAQKAVTAGTIPAQGQHNNGQCRNQNGKNSQTMGTHASNPTDKKNITCHNCGRRGHYKRECRQEGGGTYKAPANAATKGQSKQSVSHSYANNDNNKDNPITPSDFVPLRTNDVEQSSVANVLVGPSDTHNGTSESSPVTKPAVIKDADRTNTATDSTAESR